MLPSPPSAETAKTTVAFRCASALKAGATTTNAITATAMSRMNNFRRLVIKADSLSEGFGELRHHTRNAKFGESTGAQASRLQTWTIKGSKRDACALVAKLAIVLR